MYFKYGYIANPVALLTTHKICIDPLGMEMLIKYPDYVYRNFHGVFQ